ncbi:hypothetical protein VaNZ11_006491 [Volvox africanus]|uniref:Uncharacterized protein n=1 Tax=Volvox africanus TaxID=51714 RepID=A0ABQ5S0T7_9CHLO|nr:hypothetical protein VaNZ11_006491 [Volvox africanus]
MRKAFNERFPATKTSLHCARSFQYKPCYQPNLLRSFRSSCYGWLSLLQLSLLLFIFFTLFLCPSASGDSSSSSSSSSRGGDATPRLRKPQTHAPEQPQYIRQDPQLPRWQVPHCLGADGRFVDWWILLKYPNGHLAALLESHSLPPLSRPPMTLESSGKGRETRFNGGGGSGGDDDNDDNDGGHGDVGGCWWRPGVDVNDAKEPLRRTLAAAATAVAGANADTDADPDADADGSTLVSLPATGFAFYNDADPEGGEHWGFAHSKGLMIFGPSGGLWLTHSFPSFPGRPPRHSARNANSSESTLLRDQADLPTDGPMADDPWDVVRHAQTVYGQHALCLTLMREDIQRVAESLLMAQAFVYDHAMPHSLVNEYGAIQDLIDASRAREGLMEAATFSDLEGTGAGGDCIRRMLRSASGPRPKVKMPPAQLPPAPPAPPPPPPPPPDHNVSQRLLTTLGGSTWLHITKSPNFTEPFHEQVLEPLLRVDMAWETWRIGASYGSKCPPDTQYDTLNVRRVSVPLCAGGREPRRHVGAAAATATAAPATAPGTSKADNDANGGEARTMWSSGRANIAASGCRDGDSDSDGDGDGDGDGDVCSRDYDGGGDVDFGVNADGADDVVTDIDSVEWDSLKDHSKWGISTSGLGMYDTEEPGYKKPYAHLERHRIRSRPYDAAQHGGDAAAGVGRSDYLKGWSNSVGFGGLIHDGGSATQVCLGDLNRQPSQRFRGGGYVCTDDPRVWAAFRSLVVELEPCPATRARQ